MTRIQEALIAEAKKSFLFDKTEEYIELIKSTDNNEKLKEIFTALEDAYKHRDYTPPALPPIEKEVFEFEVPSKKVSIASLLKKMEKELPAPVFNQFMRLKDGKLKLSPDEFPDVMRRLIHKTFLKTDCTAHEAFFAFEVPAMQFGLVQADSTLMELISNVYTEYKFKSETDKYNSECESKEKDNTLVEENEAKISSWKEAAERVLEDELMLEVFPWIEECSIDDDDIADKLARLTCIKVDKEKHLLLDINTLKYTFEARDREEATIYISQQAQYQNPLCILEVLKEDKDGDLVKKKVPKGEIYENHLTIAQFTSYDLRAPHKYEISRDREKVGILQSGVTLANIEPKFCEECNLWISLMTADKFDEVQAWIANSFNFSVPLPVLSLLGPPNTGKSLLMLAIQEQIKNPEAALTPVLYEESGFNGALLTNPFIVADDGGLFVTPENRDLWLDRFKRYVTNSAWSVNPKYGGQTTLSGHVRAYCAFNRDKPHIRSLFHAENEALGQRIFDVEVPEENLDQIVELFRTCDVLGDKDKDDRWLQEGKLTRHVAWLIQNRDKFPVLDGTGRWGNMTEYKFKGAVASTNGQQLMLEFLQNSVADNASYSRLREIRGVNYVLFDIRTLQEAFKMSSGDRKVTEKCFKDMFGSLGIENKVTSIEGKSMRVWRIIHSEFIKVMGEIHE